MFTSYLLIAWRNLRKQRGYALINVLGLTGGVAACLLIVLYVVHEWSYDRHFAHAERLYRVESDITFGGRSMKLAVTSDPVGPYLAENDARVEVAARLRLEGTYFVKPEGQTESVRIDRMAFADSTFFDLFGLSLEAGDPRTALREPNTLVLNATTARQLFGTAPALGRSVVLDGEDAYQVTGVMPDLPGNTHFRFNVLMSMASTSEAQQGSWISHNFHTYVRLVPGATTDEVYAHLQEIVLEHVYPQAQQVLGGNDLEEFEASGNRVDYVLHPVTDIHLHSGREAEIEANGSAGRVWLFTAVALFILLMACVNFTNLATARAATRAREVGVRKAIGSVRSQLIGQFLTESTLLSAGAFLLALLVVQSVLPYYNNFTDKSLTLTGPTLTWLVPVVVLGVVVVGLLAGGYPALVLSAYRPARVLKGQVTESGRGGALRRGLVVFQFATSIALIIGTFIVGQQMRYVQKHHLGFEKERVLVIDEAYALGGQVGTFKEQITRLAGVTHATVSGFLPGPANRSESPLFPYGQHSQEAAVTLQHWRGDADYVRTMGMEIVAGRDFALDATGQPLPADSSGILLNEAAVRAFGFENPVGERVSNIVDFKTGATETLEVIGVIRDFHYESLRRPIAPLSYRLGRNSSSIAVRLASADLTGTLATIEERWTALAPGQPLS
ncbi:MAG: ABC transporter permease, partial [Catalinimonas sp.]